MNISFPTSFLLTPADEALQAVMKKNVQTNEKFRLERRKKKKNKKTQTKTQEKNIQARLNRKHMNGSTDRQS